jgi:doubled CXXCH motif protein
MRPLTRAAPRTACGLMTAICLVLAGAAPWGLQRALDPAAWGRDHVGVRVPDFVPGDECLFCHRSTVGSNWKDTVHGAAVRHREDAPALDRAIADAAPLAAVARDVEYTLGSRHRARLLKTNGFGAFALLDVQAVLTPTGGVERWTDAASPAWDGSRFAERCAGCHATAVDAKTRQFSAFGLDCYTCHGDVTLEHTKDTTLMWWSQKRRNSTEFAEVQAMTSICAQCHLRGGRSRTTGLPYANTFIAGDNLFKDYAVDLAAPQENPGDGHVFRTVRDVALGGGDTPTCLTCHRVHADSSARHASAPRSAVCMDCHEFDGPQVRTKSYRVSSAVCEYEDVPGAVSRGAKD